ncbi:MAG TPA: NAD(P)H-binding protein [Bacteroidota bacterium]|nr:NAD(P)H-binding protein [Bacteroidota bacterium]
MPEKPAAKSALVAGATGLVGRECVDLLLSNPEFTRIVALVRRSLPKEITSDILKVEKVDFERLNDRPELFAVDVIICALGTTMRAAGSEGAFRIVDYDYPLALAKLGFARGARHFLLVSSQGANAESGVFYPRVKGELENAVSEIGYRSLTIVRPSFLIGEREQRRFGEELGRRFGFLAPPRYRPVRATLVAAALVRAASEDVPGKRVIENRELRASLQTEKS